MNDEVRYSEIRIGHDHTDVCGGCGFCNSCYSVCIEIPYLAAVALYVFPGIIMIGLPYTFCHYLRMKRQAERQRQWISDGKFYLQRVLDCGWTGGGFVDHRVTVLFDRIHRIQMKKGYIVMEGEMNLVDQFNEVVREKQVTSYKVPRTFINEERVIGLVEKSNI